MKLKKILTSMSLSFCFLLGSVVSIHAVENQQSFNPILNGDYDLDNKVTLDDAYTILEIALGIKDADYFQRLICDVNQDGAVTIEDSVCLLLPALEITKPQTMSRLAYKESVRTDIMGVIAKEDLDSFEYNNDIFTRELLENVTEITMLPGINAYTTVSDPKAITEICRHLAAIKTLGKQEIIYDGFTILGLITPEYKVEVIFADDTLNNHFFEGNFEKIREIIDQNCSEYVTIEN